MKPATLVLLYLFIALPPAAFSGRLPATAIISLGESSLPDEMAFGSGLTMIPDCLGRPDPTPSDGFPGCMGGFTLDNSAAGQPALFMVFDVAAPGQKARLVVNPWDLMDGLPQRVLPSLTASQPFDVMYDKGPGYCRIWWNYGTWYVNITEDRPILAYSSCDPANPNPQGMWDIGPEWQGHIFDDPFATAKLHFSISRIPASMADAYFDGNRMALGNGINQGPRGGSQGPAQYILPMEPPATNPVLDVTAVLWYRYVEDSYVNEWQHAEDLEMQGGAVSTITLSLPKSAEYLTTPRGEAVVFAWRESWIDPANYPHNDPGAPYWNNSNNAEPGEWPTCWYGLPRHDSQNPRSPHNPSWQEWDINRNRMPPDPKIELPPGEQVYQGPHCLSLRSSWILYDPAELSLVYQGLMEHNVPQPYAQVLIPGAEIKELWGGTTSDAQHDLLYMATTGVSPKLHHFRIGGD